MSTASISLLGDGSDGSCRRDPKTSLALSSRNTYLTDHERTHAAPTLYAALNAAKTAWAAGASKGECISRAHAVIEQKKGELGDTVDLRLDYIEMNDPESFDELSPDVSRGEWEADQAGRPVILSGAMYVGKTRLIDNIVLGARHTLGIVD